MLLGNEIVGDHPLTAGAMVEERAVVHHVGVALKGVGVELISAI